MPGNSIECPATALLCKSCGVGYALPEIPPLAEETPERLARRIGELAPHRLKSLLGFLGDHEDCDWFIGSIEPLDGPNA
jgi:hypothetical protein